MKIRWSACLVVVATIVYIGAAIAAPIRVGIFKGVASGYYWHTSTHPGAEVIASMLANPAATGFPDIAIPARGFSVSMYGVDTSCAIRGCAPSTGQIAAFITALDSLDVTIFLNTYMLGAIISNSQQRQQLATFWMTKGVISVHQSSDVSGTWAPWDTLHVARFLDHPSTERNGTLHLDTVGGFHQNSSWKFLNQGLPDTVRFFDEWFSFTSSGNLIRSRVTPTVNIDEKSYDGGLGGAEEMGEDHPMSWYRELPDGGRFFYTALAHRIQTYDSVYFFRRQLYNAILWASKDTTGWGAVTTGIRPIVAGRAELGREARLSLSGGTLTVSLLRDGAHTVEIRALDGRRVATAQASGKTTHRFSELSTGSVYFVVIHAGNERLVQRIALQ